LVWFVVGGFALLGLALFVKRFIRGPRVELLRFSFEDVKRWFVSGKNGVRRLWWIMPWLAGSISLLSVLQSLSFQRLTRTQAFEYGATFSWPSAWTIVDSWANLVPTLAAHSPWLLAMFPLLAMLRGAERFPFSTGSRAGSNWLSISRIAVALWMVWFVNSARSAFFESTELPENLSWISPIMGVLGVLVWFCFGFAFIIPPLLSAVDDESNEVLARTPTQETISTLLIVQVLCFLPQLPNFVLFLLMPGSTRTFHAIEAVLRPIGIIGGTFFVTATLPACVSARAKEALLTNLKWWRRSGEFLVCLTLSTGLSVWTVAAGTRVLLKLVSRLGPLRALVGGLGALAYMTISFMAFSLLLGNWKEVRSTLTVRSPEPPASR
jgi:hypothetical protein